ncbi:uncharacterized protein LOC112602503 [Melanaphis sacchari]|uniref:uncharacterized protein LOC112602503 n=1 Tax=Melanaphis sacchari TaxID=742174 RepID=UPI000DC13038|nr:uncharacterized protein LOC112602503 [Melanaphis sacchari]
MHQKSVELVRPKQNAISKYKHVKSRYQEKSRVEKLQAYQSKHFYIKPIKRVDSNSKLDRTEFDKKKILLVDKCYAEVLDNNMYSNFINIIFDLDNRRQIKKKIYKVGPSILSEPDLLSALHDLLKLSKSPIELLHVAFIVNWYKANKTKDIINQWFNLPEYNWLWMTEIIITAALVLDSHSHDCDGVDDNRPESAVFWYAGGVFYSRNGCTEIAMEYFEKARTISDGPSKLMFPSVPADLHNEMRTKYDQFVKEPYSVWTLACLHQSDLLKKIAIDQEPEKALMTLHYVRKLLKASSEPHSMPRVLIAEVYYEMGLNYKAIGSTEHSLNAFRKCVRFSTNVHHELDLMAKLMVTKASQNPPKGWSYLELKEEAKKRLNLRMLVKTIVAIGMAAQNEERFEEGFHHFGVAEWLSRKTNEQIVDALDTEIAIFNMAICRTKMFFKVFPKASKCEPRFRMKGCNQWTHFEEHNMYYKIKKEVRELYNLFDFNDSDVDVDDEEFLENENEEISISDNV